MLPARRGLDPRKPADTDEQKFRSVSEAQIQIRTLFMRQRKTVFDVAQTYNAEGLTAIHASEGELSHSMFANDCYVKFPALAGDAMEALFARHRTHLLKFLRATTSICGVLAHYFLTLREIAHGGVTFDPSLTGSASCQARRQLDTEVLTLVVLPVRPSLGPCHWKCYPLSVIFHVSRPLLSH
ncbi:hypothetical protein B0H19DRAFT_1065786 [Mycena capillaripes]|nr:hypothetical protein B0H19DRAFT_1065786 [Mycena capillaripes]